MTCAWPFSRLRREILTGSATTRFVVKVAAAVAGRSEKMIARSRRMDFTPVWAPQHLIPLT